MTTDATDVEFTTSVVVLSTQKLIAPEGRTAQYTVRLANQPAASVTVTVAGSGDSNITFDTDPSTAGDQSTLTFTTADWSTAQTVTVAAAEESDSTDKAYGTAVLSHTADSDSGSTSSSLTVYEGDNDVCQGTTAVNSAASGGLVDDCNTLLAALDIISGPEALSGNNWSTDTPIGSWQAVKVTDGRVTELRMEIFLYASSRGTVPNTICDLTELTFLDMQSGAYAEYESPFPACIGTLTGLTELGFFHRQLTGPIPVSLGNLTELTELILDGNLLSGPIPASLGNLTDLETLWLNSNLLSGPIPAGLGNLTNLEILRLSHNRLSGPIPASLGNLTQLTSLNLSNNNLTGCVPSNWVGQLSDINPQSGGDLSVCDGVAVSDAHPDVPEASTVTYTVRLATAPTADVTVTLSASGDTDITVDTDSATAGDQSTLTFTTADWSTALTVTLTAAADDDAADGVATIIHTAVSADSNYNNTTNTITATEIDTPGLTATGLTATAVTLTISDHNGAWYYKQTAPVESACSTAIPAGTSTASVTGLTPGTGYAFKAYSDSGCTAELTTDATDVEFTTSVVVLSTQKLIAPEGRTAQYTVRLAVQPAASVTVTVVGSGDSDITVDTDPSTAGNQSTLTFTTAGWSTARTVTVAAAEEADSTDKAYGTAVLSHTADTDSGSTSSLTVYEGDDDVCQGTIAVGGAASGGLVDDCNTLLAALDIISGPEALSGNNWSTFTPIGSWQAVKVTDGRVTELNLAIFLYTSSRGTVPNTICDLTELTRLDMQSADYAEYESPFPACIATLTELTDLGLYHRQLSGPIPAGLGDLTGLTRLVLDANLLSGSIPAGLGNLTDLESLWLSHNRLSGSIPASLGDLTDLESLWLSHNRLSGSIPASLGNLTQLTNLTLGNNNLTGCVPSNWVGRLSSINPQSGGDLSVCDGVAVSDAHPDVPEESTNAYTVRLATAPTADVTVTLSASGDTDIAFDTDTATTGDQNTLTFTTADWATAQTVTLTAAHDDDDADGDTTITHTAASADADYDNTTNTITATETDNESRLTATATADTAATLTISGHTGNWYYKYTSPPGGNCSYAQSATSYTVTGLTPGTAYVFKAYSDNACTVEATTDATDAEFTTSVVALPTPKLIVPEGRTAQYTVRLAVQPAASVTVTVTKTGDSDITVDADPSTAGDQSTLTFTTADWSTARTVTVAAAEETASTDKAYGTAVLSHTADTDSGNTANRLTVYEGDDDVCQGTTAVGGATSGGLVDDCNTLLAASDVIFGSDPEAVIGNNWSTFTPIGSWKAVTAADGRITELNLDTSSYLGPRGTVGTVPNTICDLTELTRLKMESTDYAEYESTFPACIADLAGLTELGFYRRQLTGPIPAGLGDLTGLTRLVLDENRLSGPIPASLGDLTDLETLWLQRNRLSGPIPASLGNLTQVTNLALGHNDLTGCVPSNWVGRLSSINPQSGGDLSVCDGVAVSDAHPDVPEASTGTYTVRLATAPTADVTVTLSASGDTDIAFDTDTATTGDQSTLTFTTADWSTAQTVTLTAAADDDSADGVTTITHTAASADTDYDDTTNTITAIEADDDAPTLTATGVTGISATLSISFHTGVWYHKQTVPASAEGVCSTAIPAGTSTAAVTGSPLAPVTPSRLIRTAAALPS